MRKKRLWQLRPVLLLEAGVLALICILNFFWNPVIAAAESTAAAVVLILLELKFRTARRDIRRMLAEASHSLGSQNAYALESFPLPAVLVADGGEVVWYNSPFRASVLAGKDCYGAELKTLVRGFTLETLKKVETGIDVQHAETGRKFTVFGSRRQDGGYQLYFIDNTALKNTLVEYNESRPVVSIIMIDSYDELMQNAREGEKADIVGSVERLLTSWVAQTTGFLRHSDRDKYLFICEERHFRKLVENRFDILDRVRQIIVGEFMPATLSIGVGRGGGNLAENEELARQALDMALGRGGDQAAVHTPSGYEFYGGVSKGVEKRTKVKTRIIASALTELIDGSDAVLIMGHRATDLDFVGAAAGLYKAALARGCDAHIVLSKKESLAKVLIDQLEREGYDGAFVDPEDSLSFLTPKTLLIVADTHRKGYVEYPELYRAAKTVVVIDHHRKMVDFIDNAVIFYHEPYASSASEMVAELVQYIADRSVSVSEASALLAGIMLDTRNFSIRTGVRTFEAAAYLKRKGADTVRVWQLFSNSLDDYRRRADIVAAAEIYKGCAVSVYEGEPFDNLRTVAPQASDELLTISGVAASFVLYGNGGGTSISARSMGGVNVQLVMEKLGGGGHLTMAGTQMNAVPPQKAALQLKKAIDEYYQENQKADDRRF